MIDKNFIKLFFITCIILLGSAFLHKYITINYPDFFSDSKNLATFYTSLLILSSIIYSALTKNEVKKFFLQLLIWSGIFLVIITIYAFRFELNYTYKRVLAVLIPSHSWVDAQGEIIIARSEDGHFYLEGFVDNIKIKFMVDTGASDVALTSNDAKKLGFDLTKLKYTKTYLTANGPSRAAPIILEKLTIGREFKNVAAHVGVGNLDISLLGMSILQRFRGFKIEKDLLILNY